MVDAFDTPVGSDEYSHFVAGGGCFDGELLPGVVGRTGATPNDIAIAPQSAAVGIKTATHVHVQASVGGVARGHRSIATAVESEAVGGSGYNVDSLPYTSGPGVPVVANILGGTATMFEISGLAPAG